MAANPAAAGRAAGRASHCSLWRSSRGTGRVKHLPTEREGTHEDGRYLLELLAAHIHPLDVCISWEEKSYLLLQRGLYSLCAASIIKGEEAS